MKIVTIVGARPQFIKASVLRQIFLANKVNEVLVHTGQHFDVNMSEVFFQQLNIAKPDYHVALNARSHGAMTADILKSCEEILAKEKPNFCLVYGDTNSTLAGALAAAKLNIPICHVEAGLRSYNREMPEEINRVLTDHVSALLMCPTPLAVSNLAKEGIAEGVFHTGDIMQDAVRLMKQRGDLNLSGGMPWVSDGRPLALMTLHRQETVDVASRLSEAVSFCKQFAIEHNVIFPVHPRTGDKLRNSGIDLSGIQVVSPLGYLELNRLLSNCDLVLTDSGGLQKEAYFHRVPCITLRDETEWVETLDAGWNRLWKQPDNALPKTDITDYGDGYAGEKILRCLLNGVGRV